MAEEGDNYYTVDDAAGVLELSPACVRQMLRTGELEGERREERIEGVLGPWRIPKRVVHDLREGEPDVLRAKHRDVYDPDSTTANTPLGETTTATSPEALVSSEEAGAETPSEAAELLSESVREVRKRRRYCGRSLGFWRADWNIWRLRSPDCGRACSGRRNEPTASGREPTGCETSSRRSAPAGAKSCRISGGGYSGTDLAAKLNITRK